MQKILWTLSLLFFISCEKTIEQGALLPIPTLIVDEGKSVSLNLSNYTNGPISNIHVPGHPFLDVTYFSHNDSLVVTPKPQAPRLSKIGLTVNGRNEEILLRIRPLIEHTFIYTPEENISTVVVMGQFNDWSRTALPLTDNDGDGTLERTIYLKPERHEYKFVVDGEEMIDPKNDVFISNNIGGWNSILDLSGEKEKPAGYYIKKSYSGGKLWYDFVPSEDGMVPVFPYVYFNNQPVHNDAFDPLPDGGLSVNLSRMKDGTLRITGLDEKGRAIDDNMTLIRHGKPLSPDLHSDTWHFSVLYSIMTDRFLDGNPENTVRSNTPGLHDKANWYGGDFAGIIQKLEGGYFSDLGINTIWISPVQQQPEEGWKESIPPNRVYTGYHGYWPVEPRKVDPRFGTLEELQTLVRLAHANGIRIILDFVSNHVHELHPYYTENRDWFGEVTLENGTLNVRNWSEETRLTTWFDTFIPSYNYPAAPGAIDQVVEDAVWWMKTLNIDGFRQDAVKHVPHAFWRQLTTRLKEEFPLKNIYQIGETFGSDALIGSYVNPGELSSQFNFSIYFNARNQFAADEADFKHLAQIVSDNALAFGPIHLMGNITSSHDQMKFMAVADGQADWGTNGTEMGFSNPPIPSKNKISFQKLANFHALNLALPGIPVVYYGEEIGLMGAADPDNRRPMKFGQDVHPFGQELKSRFSALNFLRSKYPSLSIGDLIPVHQDGPVWVFIKQYFDERILVVFNHSNSTREISLNLNKTTSAAMNLLSDEKLMAKQGIISFKPSPYSHYFFLLE